MLNTEKTAEATIHNIGDHISNGLMVLEPPLQTETSVDWVKVALTDLPALLSDHVHCERKAAQSALSIIRNYPQYPRIIEAVSRLAHEETSHVIAVSQQLKQRGFLVQHDRGDDYAQALRRHIRKNEPGRLLDILLVFGLIEARSAERLQLLAAAIDGDDTQKLYQSLATAERRHRDIFFHLAQSITERDTFEVRLKQLAKEEATIVTALPLRAAIH